jgi:hypothetical protein
MADPKVELYAHQHKLSNNEAKRRMGRKSAIKKHTAAAPETRGGKKARGE